MSDIRSFFGGKPAAAAKAAASPSAAKREPAPAVEGAVARKRLRKVADEDEGEGSGVQGDASKPEAPAASKPEAEAPAAAKDPAVAKASPKPSLAESPAKSPAKLGKSPAKPAVAPTPPQEKAEKAGKGKSKPKEAKEEAADLAGSEEEEEDDDEEEKGAKASPLKLRQAGNSKDSKGVVAKSQIANMKKFYDTAKNFTLEGAKANWKKGEPVPYSFLCKAFDLCGQTTKRIEITNIMTDALRAILELTPADLLPALYLSLNQVPL
jgi:DNA ligase-1